MREHVVREHGPEPRRAPKLERAACVAPHADDEARSAVVLIAADRVAADLLVLAALAAVAADGAVHVEMLVEATLARELVVEQEVAVGDVAGLADSVAGDGVAVVVEEVAVDVGVGLRRGHVTAAHPDAIAAAGTRHLVVDVVAGDAGVVGRVAGVGGGGHAGPWGGPPPDLVVVDHHAVYEHGLVVADRIAIGTDDEVLPPDLAPRAESPG